MVYFVYILIPELYKLAVRLNFKTLFGDTYATYTNISYDGMVQFSK